MAATHENLKYTLRLTPDDAGSLATTREITVGQLAARAAA